jgi:hypothetical protein
MKLEMGIGDDDNVDGKVYVGKHFDPTERFRFCNSKNSNVALKNEMLPPHLAILQLSSADSTC